MSVAGLLDDLRAQREFLRTRSPIYAHLLELMPSVLVGDALARLADAWRERRFGGFYERPLLLLSALRHDALREGTDHPLWSALAAPRPSPDRATGGALRAALDADRRDLWRTLATAHVQTNEPSRGVAWLWPAAILASVDAKRPLALFDVGASAGLNLVADRLRPIWSRGDGAPLDLSPRPPVSRRVGFDVRPLDPTEEAGARWLRACVWPDQPERLTLLQEGITAFRAAADGPAAPTLQQASAGEVPDRLPTFGAGTRAISYQSVLRDYLPPDEARRYHDGMCRWLARCAPGSALWVELEITDAARRGGPPAALACHVRGASGVERMLLAHCEPHPRRIHVFDDAVARLRASLV